MNTIVGVAWFDEADYDSLLAIFPGQIHPTFQQWKRNATEGVKELERQGCTVVKVNINPRTFPTWCAARGLKVDAHARSVFAVEEAEKPRRAPH